ncbi:MAG: GNAT family N-acetyltransferase [Thermoguttaceae bacterium]
MSIRNLDKIFDPQRIAVIGANETATSVGYTVFRNLSASDYQGVVYPVNPRFEAVQGIPAYKDIESVPAVVDLAVICTAAPIVPEIVRSCGEKGIPGIVILSAGFREAGQSGRELEGAIRHEQRKFDGMRIVGPNCLGIIVPRLHLNASFAAMTPAPGHIGFISQSGALCTSVLDWAMDEGIGFSHFVSVGNMLDVSMGDLIDYLGSATETRSIILYIESIGEAREFLSAARAFARTKPIVAYKAGRFPESAQAAASHTGAMAGVDAVYEAAFQRAGIERILEIDDMFDCAELLARQLSPKSDRLAIVSNAGGPGVMTTDALIARGGRLAALAPETIEELNQFLPECWSHGNPVDLVGDAPPERFSRALETVLKDKNVDAALVILTPLAMTDATATARAVANVATQARKPVLAAWMGSRVVREGIQVLNAMGVPTYKTPAKAVQAFLHLVSYARNLTILHETPRDLPIEFGLDRRQRRTAFQALLAEGRDVLSESLSKALLESYEIPVTRPHAARTADEAVQAAEGLGYPVVVKIESPQISHKTEVDGVILNLPNSAAVCAAFQQITARARQMRPDAEIAGVTVQKMIGYANSFELILGTKRDPVFGPVIMVGMGGVAAEVFQDRALGLPPLNDVLARRMLESLKSWPLLRGYRGKPGGNIDRLIEIIMRFSYLVADYPEIQELDINPLLVTPEAVIALDARVVVDRQPPGRTPVGREVRPYSHLAIQPYPEEYVTQRKLKDGTVVALRPIKPEEEPLWHDLLTNCSTQSRWFRFNYVFKQTTHEMASRYCYIDYDRELAIVAEVEEQGERKLIGIGRLVADVDHQVAEYAVIVVDRWQGRGLGGLLTDYCLELAKKWGVKQVVAEIAKDNSRMLATFRNRGFEITSPMKQDVAMATKTLG